MNIESALAQIVAASKQREQEPPVEALVFLAVTFFRNQERIAAALEKIAAHMPNPPSIPYG